MDYDDLAGASSAATSGTAVVNFVFAGATIRYEIPIATVRAAAIAAVDAAAEAARGAFLTPGSGQAQEYLMTNQQARAYAAAGYPTPFDAAKQATYAFVYAEMLARADAETLTLSTQGEIDAAALLVTNVIITESDAYEAAGAVIKRLRRAAKQKIERALAHKGIYDARNGIAWPTPGS